MLNITEAATRCAMPAIEIIWDLEDDPEGNVAHLAEHDVSQDEVLEVLTAPTAREAFGRPNSNAISE